MTNKRSPSFVIAISGPSGAGKTSLVQKVTSLLEDAISFYFDDYASVSKYPSNFSEWIEEGADPNQWKTPQLLKDLQRLRSGEAISLPTHKGMIKAATFIVMEEPFGKERSEMSGLIDFVACIDLPLEVALARRLLRDIEWCVSERDPAYLAAYLKEYLTGYLRGATREMYLEVNARVLENCDLVLDGVKPLDELADEIVAAIKTKLGAA
jgi:uridine kinase